MMKPKGHYRDKAGRWQLKSNTFTDPEAHELADAINVVQDRVDAVITQHRVLEERVSSLEAYYGDLEKSVARLERVVATIVDYHQEGEIAPLPEPPDASWRD